MEKLNLELKNKEKEWIETEEMYKKRLENTLQNVKDIAVEDNQHKQQIIDLEKRFGFFI